MISRAREGGHKSYTTCCYITALPTTLLSRGGLSDSSVLSPGRDLVPVRLFFFSRFVCFSKTAHRCLSFENH